MEWPHDHSRGNLKTFKNLLIVKLFSKPIPRQARQIKKCMTSHQECVSYEVLRREAQETMDPSDPSYGMYDNKMKEGKVEERVEKKKRERLIINPEFVESMDQGDGAEEFDSDPFDYNNEV